MMRVRRITDVIRDTFPSVGEVQPTSRLVQDLELDSLDRIDLTLRLEEEFGLRIDDDEARRWETVEDIDRYLERLEER